MKAAFINRTGPPEEIIYGDLPDPIPGPHDVLVKVSAITVDPIDTYIRAGRYRIEMPIPFIIGRDMTGFVEAIGDKVTGFKPGDRVWANNQGYGGRQGTFAELLSIDKQFLYHLPPGVDERAAVASFHSALTSVVGLCTKAGIKAGETLFINGGSGNVGSIGIQLAKSLGAKVAVTAGSEEKMSWCKELGADLVINYKTENIKDRLLEFAPHGVDVYWDTTRSPDVESALAVMAQRARMLIMSGLGYRSVLPIGEFYTRNCTLYGYTITDRTVEELAEGSRQINALLKGGTLKGKIHKTMPLSEAATAHRLVETSDLFGKLVLTPP